MAEAAAQHTESLQQLQQALNLVAQMQASVGWRVLERTRRLAIAVLPTRFRRWGRKGVKAIYLTVRGRLPAHLRARRQTLAESVPPVLARGECARRPEDDYAVAIPFAWQSGGTTSDDRRSAAVIHMYYEDLAPEFYRYLLNVPSPLDVYVSTVDEHRAAIIRRVFHDWPKGKVEVRVAPNRGRDIAPKLIAFADIYPQYDYVLHLHSKRSPHASVLALWRQFLLESLVGSPTVVSSIFELFDENPSLGMVAAQHYEPLRGWLTWGGNLEQATTLAQRMGINVDAEAPLDCPTGSMFWARTSALQPLLSLQLRPEDFPDEAAQTDTTLAHAIERLYFHVCEQAGMTWLKVARPEFYDFTPNIIRAAAPEQLARVVKTCTFSLLRPGQIRPRQRALQHIKRTPPQLARAVLRQALGLDIARPTRPYRIAIGVLSTAESKGEKHTFEAARLALAHASAQGWAEGDIVLISSTAAEFQAPAASDHNAPMAHAFGQQVDAYLALRSGIVLAPNALLAMLRMLCAHADMALVQAHRLASVSPQRYDTCSFDAPWVTSDYLLIPSAVHALVGGFDASLQSICADVDFSWRAHVSGLRTIVCASAACVVLDGDQAHASQVNTVFALRSAIRLAKKWHAPDFAAQARDELRALRWIESLEDEAPSPPVPDHWKRHADFRQQLRFALGD